jgi:distribution and morphology protein 34
MAFNFNWSPLMADAGFYTRAQDLLTAALNKSPKPPIIVDDIHVTELNLGSIPPDLEILEIGDLAEDRFRGIFKMSYTGDAFLTLKTRVQANPLNTFLLTRPTFASPIPLAAAYVMPATWMNRLRLIHVLTVANIVPRSQYRCKSPCRISSYRDSSY